MINIHDYLESLISKHGLNDDLYTGLETNEIADQALSELYWDDICDVEIIPLSGGGYEANIIFSNGMAVGTPREARHNTIEDAESYLAMQALMLRSKKPKESASEFAYFRIDDVSMSIARHHIEYIYDNIGNNENSSPDAIIARSINIIDQAVCKYGYDINDMDMFWRMQFLGAISSMIMNNHPICWTHNYRNVRESNRIPGSVGHA